MFERIFPGELNKWKRKFVNLRVSLELTVEFFWLNWYIYFRTVSYMGTQINLRLTIEITIVYHVNGCRWLKRQCYKFAYWIRHWHIPNVTVTKKIDNAIITVCSYEFSSWVAWVRCDICHQYTFVTNIALSSISSSKSLTHCHLVVTIWNWDQFSGMSVYITIVMFHSEFQSLDIYANDAKVLNTHNNLLNNVLIWTANVKLCKPDLFLNMMLS